jgi:hypothetical protein
VLFLLAVAVSQSRERFEQELMAMVEKLTGAQTGWRESLDAKSVEVSQHAHCFHPSFALCPHLARRTR